VRTSGGNPEKLIASTKLESEPQYSPDGQVIAFVSTRSGASEIWACDRNGGHAGRN